MPEFLLFLYDFKKLSIDLKKYLKKYNVRVVS